MGNSTHRCSRCKLDKPASDFAPSIVSRKTGGYCRACRSLRYQENAVAERNRDATRRRDPAFRLTKLEHSRRYRAKVAASPELADKAARRDRASGLQRRYGMTIEQYDVMLAAQHGRCACCGGTDVRRTGVRAGRQMFVDHDHETGAIRGLICHGCNAGIGKLGDSAAGVRRALTYLTKPDLSGIGAGLLY